MQTTHYPELDESASYQLWVATNRWQRTARRVLEPLGLTHCQYLVLGVTRFLLERHPQVTQAQVARTADVDEMMVSQVVRTLEGQGLLRREPHPEDARARCLLLTDLGEQKAAEAKELMKAEATTFFAPIGDQLPELTKLLRTLASAE